MAVEPGNCENNYFVLAGGQSGNPLSPHYTDQLALWLRGEGITLAWSEESVAETATTELMLKPG